MRCDALQYDTIRWDWYYYDPKIDDDNGLEKDFDG